MRCGGVARVERAAGDDALAKPAKGVDDGVRTRATHFNEPQASS